MFEAIAFPLANMSAALSDKASALDEIPTALSSIAAVLEEMLDCDETCGTNSFTDQLAWACS